MGATWREGQEKMEENWILPKIDAPKIPGREFEWQAVSNRIQNTLYGPSLCPRGRITVRNSLPNKAQNTGTSLPLFPEFCWDLWPADCHRDTGGQVDTCHLPLHPGLSYLFFLLVTSGCIREKKANLTHWLQFTHTDVCSGFWIV